MSAGCEGSTSSSPDWLNVAVRVLSAVSSIVCAPRLLDADCKTVEQMRLVNAVCRFVELAHDES